MADLESQIRLALELTGAKTAKEAADEIERLGKEAGKTKQEIEEATRILRYYEEILRGATSAEDAATRAAVEQAQAQRAIRQALEESEAELVIYKNTAAETTARGEGGFKDLTRGIFDMEKAATAVATGSGLGRLGGILERVVGSAGGVAGAGFGIAAVLQGLEGIGPKLAHWLNAENIALAKDLADHMQRQADAADRLANRPTKQEENRAKDIEEYVTEVAGGAKLRGQIAAAIRKDPNAMLTPDEAGQLQMQGAPGSEAMVRRRNEQIRAQQEERITNETNRIFGGLGNDEKARLKAIDLAETRPGTIPIAVADALRQAQAGNEIGPSHIAAQKAKDDEAEREALHEIAAKQEKESNRIKKEIEDRVKAAKDQKAAAIKDAREASKYNKELLELQGEDPASLKRAEAEQSRINIEKARDYLKDQRDAEHDRKQAEHAAVKFARENTPAALNRAAIQQQENEDLGVVQQYAPNLDPELQKSAAKHARENHKAGFDMSATFQQALDYAIEQARQDFNRGIQSGLKASQGHNPTQYGRGGG